MNRESILKLVATLPVEQIVVAGISEPFYLRGLTAGERDAFEAACFVGKGPNKEMNFVNLRARLLVRALCDKDGTRLFTDSEVETVAGLPARIVDPLFDAAQKLSGMGAKDVEALAGN